MRQVHQVTALIERESDGYVALCPELDIASQGSTIEEARANLIEAIELFLMTASPSEVQERLHSEVYVTRLEVGVGYTASAARRALSGLSALHFATSRRILPVGQEPLGRQPRATR